MRAYDDPEVMRIDAEIAEVRGSAEPMSVIGKRLQQLHEQRTVAWNAALARIRDYFPAGKTPEQWMEERAKACVKVNDMKTKENT